MNKNTKGIANKGPLLADRITANKANIIPAEGSKIDVEVFFA